MKMRFHSPANHTHHMTRCVQGLALIENWLFKTLLLLIFLFNIFLLQEEYARLQQENRERQMEVRHTALMFDYSH